LQSGINAPAVILDLSHYLISPNQSFWGMLDDFYNDDPYISYFNLGKEGYIGQAQQVSPDFSGSIVIGFDFTKTNVIEVKFQNIAQTFI